MRRHAQGQRRANWFEKAMSRMQPSTPPVPRSRSKYGAIRTAVDGHLFASKREALRYSQLRLLERAGEIQSLVLQPAFPLCVVNLETGEITQIGIYKSDFKYLDVRTQLTVIEDAKGWRTRDYKRTKKHIEGQYGVQIIEV